WVQPFEGGQAIQITDNKGKDHSPAWSHDGNTIYFLSDRGGSQQVWAVGTDGSSLRQLSFMDKDVTGFGISPKGDKAWLVMEVAVEKVASAQIYDSLDKSRALIYDDLMERHWDCWEDGDYSHLFVAAVTDNGITTPEDITPDEPWDIPTAPDFDNAEITWNNGGTALIYTARKLQGYQYAMSTNTDLYLYTIESKKTFNLTDGMVGYDKYPVFSPDDKWVAWLSMERAGVESDKSRLMVQQVPTGERKYLTRNFDYNAANVSWSSDCQTLFFIAPIEATHQICSVDVASSQVKVLTQGDHDYCTFSKVGDRMVAEKTTISMATEIFAVNLTDGTDSQVSFINKRIYDNVDMGRVDKRWITTTDGKNMLTWVILPPNFDSTKKYPTLLYCQGGPQSVVSQRWSYRWNYQLMASQGYIVVAPNRRGLPSFGQEWLDQISGDYAGQNIKDYFSAIDCLSKEPYVDKDKLGCVGASYGGYSVFYIAGHHQKRFKAFISHCGIFDFTSMYGETEELWFVNQDYGGAYWDKDNKVAQKSYANSPHQFVNNWDTPIMIITGMKDFRIPYTQSLEAFTAAKAHGLDARLVVFENEAHQVFKPQNSLVWNREFFGWLDKYLK
ncbi:MAG: S9 family peptidase, partial [Mucinivorans sp.]